MERPIHLSKKLYVWAGYVVVLLCLYFTGSRLVRHWAELESLLADPQVLASLIIGGCYYSLVLIFMVGVWHLPVRQLSGSVRFRTSYFIYSRTSIAKYLPGNVGHFVGRQLTARRLGIAQSAVAMGTGLEMLCQLSAGLLIVLWIDLPMAPVLPPWAILLVCLLGLILAPSVILRFSRYMHLDLSETMGHRSLWATILAACSLALLFFVGTGLIVVFLVRLVSPDSAVSGISLVAIYAMAWFLGTVTPGAPAGIGVREAVFLAALGPSMEGDAALAVALLFRAITLLGDVIFYASSYLVSDK